MTVTFNVYKRGLYHKFDSSLSTVVHQDLIKAFHPTELKHLDLQKYFFKEPLNNFTGSRSNFGRLKFGDSFSNKTVLLDLHFS